MQIIYATGSPRSLDFQITGERQSVPHGATIFAICEGARTLENQDEDLFEAMTDEEYFTLRALVQQAEKTETEGQPQPQTALRGFFGRLSALIFNHRADAAAHSLKSRSHASRPRNIIPLQQS